jgi:hypothetical protein
LAHQNARFAARLYEVLLHLYPADFRQSYGEAMTCIFEESLRDASAKSGRGVVLRLWLHTLIDLATAALAEWVSRFLFSIGIEQQTSLGASIAISIVLFILVLMGVNAGRLHPRQSATPVCGMVDVPRVSSSAPASGHTMPNSQSAAR